MLHKMDALNLAVTEQKVNPGALVVLVRLLHHYNTDTHKCYPSVQTIARGTGFTSRTVSTHLRALQAAGYITVHSGMSEYGTNRYDLPVLTGKTECSPSEVPRRKGPRKISAKPFRNPKDNPYRIEGKRVQALALNTTRRNQDAMKESNLEKALTEALGGGEAGLEALMRVPDPILIEAKRSHLVDGLPRATAVNAAIKKIRELEDG